MQVEEIPLAQLQPAPYNPRVTLEPGMPGYERLARSLSEFELVQPLVWNRRTGHVVGGHQRRAILAAAGRESAPCVVVDLDESREKALNVALNNDRVGGDWDPDKLLPLLEELVADELDETLTGFEPADFREFLLDESPTFEPVAEPPCEHVRAVLEIPPPDWDEARTWIDAVLDALPSLRVHITGEPAGDDCEHRTTARTAP